MCRRHVSLWVCCAAVALAMVADKAASAQSAFGFSISSGGGHHGHHGHHHHHHHHPRWSFGYSAGPWWGPAYYVPPPAVVYAAPPVVQERVIYVQPPASPPPPIVSPYSSTQQPQGSFAASNSPAVSRASEPDDRIVIRNAAGAQLPVAFVVDGQDIELADGSTRTFVGRAQRTIQYDRGGKFGSTQQDLTGGQYEFRITATGWDLVRRPDVAASRTAVKANTLPSGAVR